MLKGVLSDAYIRENCWEHTAPMSFKKRVMKPITIAPMGNMRNSFTFAAPQPTLINLATNIIASTPKKNLPTNTDIVPAVIESLIKAENTYIPSEFMIRYDPTYDYQTGGEARQGKDAMLALQEMATQMSESLRRERLQDVASQMASGIKQERLQDVASQMASGLQEERLSMPPPMYLSRQGMAEMRTRAAAELPSRGETPFRPNLSPSQQARFNQAENRGPSESPTRPEGMYRRTRGIPGRYGGIERVPDSPQE